MQRLHAHFLVFRRVMAVLSRLTAFLSLLLFSQLASGQELKSGTSKPFVLGSIEQIHSDILGEERTLNIYLPEGYNAADTARYPVVYLLDGSADEDFIHVVGLFQFNSFPWINRVPKSIIVGIANLDRRRDFTYPTTIAEDKEQNPTSGKSEAFIGFIEKELQPFVGRKFKTTKSKMIIGQSLGGLLAAEILLKKPGLFDKYVVISPSFWWDNGSLLKMQSPIFEKSFQQPVSVYIGVGKEGLGPGKYPHVMEVDANLFADKLKNSGNSRLSVHFDYLPEEDHATVTHQATFNALRMLYPDVKK